MGFFIQFAWQLSSTSANRRLNACLSADRAEAKMPLKGTSLPRQPLGEMQFAWRSECMKKENAHWISLGISILALLATGISIYVNYFRPVAIAVQISPYVYISNTIGGLPKVKMSLGIIGSGSGNKYECISNIRATIREKREGIEKGIDMIPIAESRISIFTLTRSDDILPIYIRGGNEKILSIEFGYENTVNKIVKIKEWAASLKNENISEEQKKAVDEIIAPYVGGYYSKSELKSDLGYLIDLPKKPKISIESVLRNFSPDIARKYIFFTGGNYELTIKCYSASNRLIKECSINLSIDSLDAGRLMNVFDEWTVKRI